MLFGNMRVRIMTESDAFFWSDLSSSGQCKVNVFTCAWCNKVVEVFGERGYTCIALRNYLNTQTAQENLLMYLMRILELG